MLFWEVENNSKRPEDALAEKHQCVANNQSPGNQEMLAHLKISRVLKQSHKKTEQLISQLSQHEDCGSPSILSGQAGCLRELCLFIHQTNPSTQAD